MSATRTQQTTFQQFFQFFGQTAGVDLFEQMSAGNEK